MPHTKKQRLEDGHAVASANSSDHALTLNDLSVDVLADILGYLDGPKDIMCKRRVCRKWKEAVKQTIVPPTDFSVESMEGYNTMRVMTKAMPNLQQLTLTTLGYGHKYSEGEDPSKGYISRTIFANYTSHDINIISNFSKLRILEIDTFLNGRYPFLFNCFPLIQKLSITGCVYLNFDLEMLAGFSLLKELICIGNERLTGNISSLKVLKDTLEKVNIGGCPNVEGNFMDLADFPHLKKLDLLGTAATGDIRDIGENDFSSLEQLTLPDGVYGGIDCDIHSISDGHDLMRTLYLFGKQRPAVLNMKDYSGFKLYWQLSQDSPDWYDWVNEGTNETPPFFISLVTAGPRVGYRWETDLQYPCEVNWLDPEPDRESSEYGKYIEELQQINSDLNFYKGFYQPPTEEEYLRLHDG
jgi:hypothetical protein